jgi:hypothetical protein
MFPKFGRAAVVNAQPGNQPRDVAPNQSRASGATVSSHMLEAELQDLVLDSCQTVPV